jgi:DnaJ like chaperone protein
MNSFDNTIEVAKKYLSLTKNEYHKRLKVMEYLLNLAFIDNDFSKAEYMITEDIANALEIKRADFENMIAQFEQFYAQQTDTKELSLEKACKVLNVSIHDDMVTIKKQYRTLVKQNHPDIITGKGASQSIIDEATKKLQEINEAYEILKKEKK